MSKLKIIEVFESIQGEGERTGYTSLFVRFEGCNLRCVFKDKDGNTVSKCDTPYTSHDTSNNQQYYSVQNVVDAWEESAATDLIFTGGEPMMYQGIMDEILESILERTKNTFRSYPVVTIETNGTIESKDSFKYKDMISLWSVSPKLVNSQPTVQDNVSESLCKSHALNSKKIDLISQIIYSRLYFGGGSRLQIKVPVSDESCIDEVDDLRARIYSEVTERCKKYIEDVSDEVDEDFCWDIEDHNFISKCIDESIMLMPVGTTKDEIESVTPKIINICIQKGFRFSTRLHILIWNDKKLV